MKDKFESFKKAYLELNEITNINEKSEITRDAAIQRFEFTFELCWKTLRERS